MSKDFTSKDATCIICLNLALPPLVSPCPCGNLYCKSCFAQTLDQYGGKCMTCKMRLRGKVRRQTGATEDEKLEHFVSAEIYEKIRNAFPDQWLCLSRVTARRWKFRSGRCGY